MILHFLRHAQAETFDRKKHRSDQNRLLTGAGRELLRQAARGYVKMGVKFDAIIASPYARAVETAKIVSDVYRFKNAVQLSEHLTPDSGFAGFRGEFLRSWCDFKSVLFVTHQPFVSECISMLLAKQCSTLAIDMGTATLCTLEADSNLRAAAILISMVKAEQAAALGAAK